MQIPFPPPRQRQKERGAAKARETVAQKQEIFHYERRSGRRINMAKCIVLSPWIQLCLVRIGIKCSPTFAEADYNFSHSQLENVNPNVLFGVTSVKGNGYAWHIFKKEVCLHEIYFHLVSNILTRKFSFYFFFSFFFINHVRICIMN